MSQQWEFKTVIWRQEENGNANMLGKDRWELAGTLMPKSTDFQSGIHHGCFLAVFMRKVIPDEDPEG